MLSVVDAQLIEEARRFELRFTCQSCAHFDPEQRRCGNGYPSEPHQTDELASHDAIAFCKEFELS